MKRYTIHPIIAYIVHLSGMEGAHINELATSIMNTLHKIITIGLLIVSLNLSGQDLRILNTKDLIPISNSFGLDSALNLTTNIPIYYIDPDVAKQLVGLTKNATPSSKIEYFLVDYALHIRDNKKLPDLLYDYFNRQRPLIKDYEPDYPYSLPRISQDALFALIEYPTDKTDSLLIGYYKDWNEKSKKYYSDYLKGKTETNSRKKEKLMSPFEDCNYNCYVILLALDSLGSDFFNRDTLEKHQSNLKSYWQDGFGIHKSGDFTDYNRSNPIKSIELSKAYNSIGEIEFDKEPDLKDMFKRYNKTYCWKFVIYKDKIGYLDLGCQSGPLAGFGVFYRLELTENILIIHEIQTWIS